MGPLRRAICILAAVLVACTGSQQSSGERPGERVRETARTGTHDKRDRPGDKREARLPGPLAPVPRRPNRLARLISSTERSLNRDVERWRRSGARPKTPLAGAVLLRAVYRQRAYNVLSENPGLEQAVLRRLGPRVRAEVAANVAAGRGIRGLVTPQPPPARRKYRIVRPLPPHTLRRFYKKAERRFGVPWEVLAAVNFVESKFGRIPGTSYAGAQGPMQFIPSTWAAYGMGGDVMDPHDAIMGAANYLRASGAPHDMQSALFAYNRAQAYVDAIRIYARQIERDVRNYYDYYFWQVVFKTTAGDVLLRSPELRRKARIPRNTN